MNFEASETLVSIDFAKELNLSMSQIYKKYTCSNQDEHVKVLRDIEKAKFYFEYSSEPLTFVTHSDDECPPLVTFPPTYFKILFSFHFY